MVVDSGVTEGWMGAMHHLASHSVAQILTKLHGVFNCSPCCSTIISASEAAYEINVVVSRALSPIVEARGRVPSIVSAIRGGGDSADIYLALQQLFRPMRYLSFDLCIKVIIAVMWHGAQAPELRTPLESWITMLKCSAKLHLDLQALNMEIDTFGPSDNDDDYVEAKDALYGSISKVTSDLVWQLKRCTHLVHFLRTNDTGMPSLPAEVYQVTEMQPTY